jgi:hypothetical protein
MHSPQLTQLLALALSVGTVTQASWLDSRVFGQVNYENAVVKRQVVSSTGTVRPTSVSEVTLIPPTSTRITSEEETPTTAPTTSEEEEETTSPTSNPTTSEDDPAPTTSNGNAGTTPTTAVPAPTPTTTIDSTGGTIVTTPPPTSQPSDSPTPTSEGEVETQSTTEVPVETTSIITRVMTLPNGSQSTSLESSVYTTSVPTPATGGDNSGGGSNITPEQRNIIIGVCVGVGGAIILGVGGLLFWRLRNKRRSTDNNDDITGYSTGFATGAAEKPDSSASPGTGRSPFQSTLESYHAPTQTNAASNF